MRLASSSTRLLVIATIGLSGSAVMAADANRGAELAKRWCATCHLVDSGQPQASADVPPFATIARRSDFTSEKVAFFLLDPHPKIPNFPLSRSEAADIAGYIESLRNRAPWVAELSWHPQGSSLNTIINDINNAIATARHRGCG